MSTINVKIANEEPMLNSYLGMPLSTTHTTHRQRAATGFSDNIVQSFWDIIDDHHNGTIRYAKQFAKGGILAAYLYFGSMLIQRNAQQSQNFVLRKFNRYCRNNYFGLFNVVRGRFTALFITGGLASVGYDLYCQQFKDLDIKQNYKNMLIKSTYTAALFGVFIHPRTIMVGAITGAMASSAQYYFVYQRKYEPQSTRGLGIQLDGLSEEQIERQNQRDQVEAMGQFLASKGPNFISF